MTGVRAVLYLYLQYLPGGTRSHMAIQGGASSRKKEQKRAKKGAVSSPFSGASNAISQMYRAHACVVTGTLSKTKKSLPKGILFGSCHLFMILT
jgi:hypothetical protein